MSLLPLRLALVVGVSIRGLGARIPCGPGEILMAVSSLYVAKYVQITDLCCVACWVTSGCDSYQSHRWECRERELENGLQAKSVTGHLPSPKGSVIVSGFHCLRLFRRWCCYNTYFVLTLRVHIGICFFACVWVQYVKIIEYKIFEGV